MSSIYLIRHGQASFGAADYDALSPLGFEQARVLGERLALRLANDARPLHAFAGNMRRHRETAATCLAALAHAGEPAIDAGFNEYDHEQVIDCFEPRYRDRALMQAELRQAPDPRRAFQQMFEAAVARWTGGEYDGEYRESWPAFRTRCQAALRQVIAATPHDGTALVFTSGGTITALCQGIMDLSNDAAFRLNWTLANAGLTKLRAGGGGVRLITLNEQSQFEGEHAALLSYR